MNKIAVVTGSNKGIGLAIVRALCKKYEGNVYLTSRDVDRGSAAVKLLQSEGLNPNFHQLDVNDMDSINKLHDYINTQYQGIDVLINNAGIMYQPTDTTPIGTQAVDTLNTNYFSTLNTSNKLLPLVQSGGRVVNISGMLAPMALKKCSPPLQELFRSDTITMEELTSAMNDFIEAAKNGSLKEAGYPPNAYAVSKLGVTVMSRILARQLRDQGKNDILLNCCCPGWVSSDMGGEKAPKTPDQGAITPVHLALLPEGASEPHGQYCTNKKVRKW